MTELPQLWVRTTIGEVIEPFESIDPTLEPDRDFRYVDIGSIDNVTQTITKPKHFPGRDAPSRARRLIRKGDVLFSTVRTYLKNIAVVPEDLDGALTSTGIAVMRPGNAIESRFLFNWVRSDEFVSSMSRSQDGSLYPAVSDRDVNEGSIPLAPIAEQRRIVAKLDGLLGRTARARRELDRVPKLIAHYKQVVLRAAFSGDLTRQWRDLSGRSEPPLVTLSALVTDVRYGTSQKCYAEPKGIAVLRIPNVSSGRIDLRDLKYAELPKDEAARLLLKAGDVLVIRSNGSPDLVGRPALVTEAEAGFAYAGYLIRLRLDQNVADPAYVTHMLEAPQTRQVIETRARSTSGVHNVNSAELVALSLPQPEVDEQQEIVRRIESAFAWLDKLAAEHTRAAALLPKLEQALLAKAFRGELVAQDPNDEPASVLLERVRAARVAAPERKRKPRSSDLPRAPRQRAAMTKSRLDQDVMHQPYLAKHLRNTGGSAKVEDLFRSADLPVTDFYKQLAWEVEAGHVNARGALLEAA